MRMVAIVEGPAGIPAADQHGRIDHHDVGHGDEGGQPADDLRADARPQLLETEEALHGRTPLRKVELPRGRGQFLAEGRRAIC